MAKQSPRDRERSQERVTSGGQGLSPEDVLAGDRVTHTALHMESKSTFGTASVIVSYVNKKLNLAEGPGRAGQ